MALKGNPRKLMALRRKVAELARGDSRVRQQVAKAVGAEIRKIIKVQFETSTDPSGAPWVPTKKGRPALRSRKIPNSISARPTPRGNVQVYSKIAWLQTHQDGHVFPARKGGGQHLQFNARGRLVSMRKFLRAATDTLVIEGNGFTLYGRQTKTGLFRRKAMRVKVGEHMVGRRVLPARPIYPPSRSLPERWKHAIARGTERALEAWAQGIRSARFR